MRKLLLLLPLVALNAFSQRAISTDLGAEMGNAARDHIQNARRFARMGQQGLACDEVHSANAVMNVWFNEIKKASERMGHDDDWVFKERIGLQTAANACTTNGYPP